MKATLALEFLVSIIFLVHPDLSRATSGNINGSFTACNDSSSFSVDCLIGGGDWDAEFPMNSRIGNEMIIDPRMAVTKGFNDPTKPVVDCPGKRVRSCLPQPNGGPPRQKCSDYTRGAEC